MISSMATLLELTPGGGVMLDQNTPIVTDMTQIQGISIWKGEGTYTVACTSNMSFECWTCKDSYHVCALHGRGGFDVHTIIPESKVVAYDKPFVYRALYNVGRVLIKKIK